MSSAIAVYHGPFGRVSLYRLDRSMIRHAHREGHLIFAVGGTDGTVNVDGTLCPLTLGEAAAINTWEIHNYQAPEGSEGQNVLVLYINPTWFAAFGRLPSGLLTFGRPQIEVTRLIAVIVARIVSMLVDRRSSVVLDGLLYELTAACHAQSHTDGPAPLPGGGRINDFRVRKSIRLLTEAQGRLMDLEAVACASGLSRPHFFKLFRTQTGVTPKLFWNTIRMERALGDLAGSRKTITDISLDLGFSSQSSFSRFFTLNTGLSPTDYRRAAAVLDAGPREGTLAVPPWAGADPAGPARKETA